MSIPASDVSTDKPVQADSNAQFIDILSRLLVEPMSADRRLYFANYLRELYGLTALESDDADNGGQQ